MKTIARGLVLFSAVAALAGCVTDTSAAGLQRMGVTHPMPKGLAGDTALVACAQWVEATTPDPLMEGAKVGGVVGLLGGGIGYAVAEGASMSDPISYALLAGLVPAVVAGQGTAQNAATVRQNNMMWCLQNQQQPAKVSAPVAPPAG